MALVSQVAPQVLPLVVAVIAVDIVDADAESGAKLRRNLFPERPLRAGTAEALDVGLHEVQQHHGALHAPVYFAGRWLLPLLLHFAAEQLRAGRGGKAGGHAHHHAAIGGGRQTDGSHDSGWRVTRRQEVLGFGAEAVDDRRLVGRTVHGAEQRLALRLILLVGGRQARRLIVAVGFVLVEAHRLRADQLRRGDGLGARGGRGGRPSARRFFAVEMHVCRTREVRVDRRGGFERAVDACGRRTVAQRERFPFRLGEANC